jgi:hypothetical protein
VSSISKRHVYGETRKELQISCGRETVGEFLLRDTGKKSEGQNKGRREILFSYIKILLDNEFGT